MAEEAVDEHYFQVVLQIMDRSGLHGLGKYNLTYGSIAERAGRGVVGGINNFDGDKPSQNSPHVLRWFRKLP